MTLRVSRARRAVIVTLPMQCDLDQADLFLARHIEWVQERLGSLPAPVPFRDGVVIPLRGSPHTIRFCGSSRRGRLVSIERAADGTGQLVVPGDPARAPRRLEDWLMAEALKAKQFPEIRYEMTQPVPSSASASFAVKAHGKLTIAGVTRDAIIDVQATRNADGKYTFIGTAPIRMTSFGIKPPTAMLGTIKTGDDVKVTFRWETGREPGVTDGTIYFDDATVTLVPEGETLIPIDETDAPKPIPDEDEEPATPAAGAPPKQP